MAISAVVNTYNEEKNIERCLKSLTWADEIIVSDASSTDKTVEIAKKYTKDVFVHNDKSGYVEPQRSAAIEKGSGDWILVLDADEEIPQSLAEKLKSLTENNSNMDFYEIPRKNIIFNSWIEHTGWWPDYQIRFFKKGHVLWNEEIHTQPKTTGNGQKIEPNESLAIIHHNYDTISQFIEKLNNYSTVQATEINKGDYNFIWQDIIRKPVSEFINRFFVSEGYKDGLHGLTLSMLQAFSFLVVYLKVWEMQGFKEEKSSNFLSEVEEESDTTKHELVHWFGQTKGGKSFLKKILSH